jgi:hypothetical protein
VIYYNKDQLFCYGDPLKNFILKLSGILKPIIRDSVSGCTALLQTRTDDPEFADEIVTLMIFKVSKWILRSIYFRPLYSFKSSHVTVYQSYPLTRMSGSDGVSQPGCKKMQRYDLVTYVAMPFSAPEVMVIILDFPIIVKHKACLFVARSPSRHAVLFATLQNIHERVHRTVPS